MRAFVSVSASLAALAVITAPTAAAECDISQTKCALNGGKCNIHFRNKTGDASGSASGTSLKQRSSAQTIVVKAKDDNLDRVGNKLQIVAGAKKTMNVTKKANKKNGFFEISISSQDYNLGVSGVDMSCNDIKAILNGGGSCKIFHGADGPGYLEFGLGFSCNGGNVKGPQ
ncbi:MAG: hypothetical protein AAFR51_03015 [Pseudomonadota bacterium]